MNNKILITTLTTNELSLACGGKNFLKKVGNVIAKIPKEAERVARNSIHFFGNTTNHVKDGVKDINSGIQEVHDEEQKKKEL